MSNLPFPLERPIVFLDLETTGLRIGTDRIIELALIRFSPNGDVLERVRRFNPEMPIPKEATAVHGITDADVAGEPPFTARARSLFELLDPCDLAGFNLRRYDLPMLLSEFRRAGITFETSGRKLVDVQVIFHREEPRDLGAAVKFYLGRELEDAHSALADIRATAAVLTAQFDRYPNLPRDIDGLRRPISGLPPMPRGAEPSGEGSTGTVSCTRSPAPTRTTFAGCSRTMRWILRSRRLSAVR
jgi:DNA polymerase-3 subunit epsilon